MTEFNKKHSVEHQTFKANCTACAQRLRDKDKANSTELVFSSPNKWVIIIIGSKEGLKNDWQRLEAHIQRAKLSA